MPSFKTLDDLSDLSGKRVLVRVDLNVPVKDGKVTDTTRIERVAPTILELSEKGAKVILLAHFGRPKDGPSPDLSLSLIAPSVEEVLDHAVLTASDCIGEAAASAVAAMNDGDILLLENTRFHKGEEKNDPDFTKALAANGDIYVNDAFSAAHRAHASTEGLAHHLPAYAGRTMQAELEALAKGLGNPARPVVAIVGGAKVSTKIDLLMNLVKKVDALVIGGGMANTFIAARGTNVGKSLCEHDLAETAKQIMIEAATAGCAIILPEDGVIAREFKAGAANETVDINAIPADAMVLDVGPKSVEAINAWIERAATPGLERPARCLRDRTLRCRNRRCCEICRWAHCGRQAHLRCRRRRYRLGAQPCRRCRRFHLCLDRRRCLPRMDGGQGASRRRRPQRRCCIIS